MSLPSPSLGILLLKHFPFPEVFFGKFFEGPEIIDLVTSNKNSIPPKFHIILPPYYIHTRIVTIYLLFYIIKNYILPFYSNME